MVYFSSVERGCQEEVVFDLPELSLANIDCDAITTLAASTIVAAVISY